MIDSDSPIEKERRLRQIRRLEKKLLHYTGKAIGDYQMIHPKDRVLMCLSGGKDSYTMVHMLNKLRIRSQNKFEIFAFTLDQGQPNWQDAKMRQHLEENRIPYEILKKDTYSVVIDKVPEGKTYCSLCSRMRRGTIYEYAKKHGFNKIALGHHRDDLIHSLLMSIFFKGSVSSMPPKLLSDCQQCMIIRPMVYCQESDIQKYAALLEFPIIPCNLCGSQSDLSRQWIKQWTAELAKKNPKIPSNILHALQAVHPSQLMDKKLWDFHGLEEKQQMKAPEPLLEEC